VAACPLRDRSGSRWCGCRPRGCRSRMSARCRWSAQSRCISGGGAGVPRARPRWHRIGQAGRCAACRPRSWRSCRRRWTGAGCLGLGSGPAVDPGPGHDPDRQAVPRAVHAALHFVLTAPDRLHPAGAGALRRRARRGRDHRLACRDLGEGSRLAATGAWICFEDEAGQTLRPRRPAPAPAAVTPLWSRCPAGDPGGSPSPAWCACGRERGAACSTGCVSTGDARVSAVAWLKPATPA
jgi:hypothetical protein